ncbi:MAG TPA: hypothetical protein VHC67_12195 [Gaiellaceae bacterium]|nr:hypothetical protein [Gaiellaceae bacterium]
MRPLRVLLALLFVVTACGFARSHRSPIRVTLTAQNHQPRLTLTGPNHQPPPNEQWWYCVKVRTAAGKLVPAPTRIRLQIVSGRIAVEQIGLVSLRRGYGNWCASIGGEDNVLEAVPRGKRLVFQAVVQTMGVTVRRDWRIVVRVVG